jgi:hypothetical protein
MNIGGGQKPILLQTHLKSSRATNVRRAINVSVCGL